MEMLVIAAIAFVITILVRRKEAFALRWQPTRHTWVAVGTGLAAFAFSASLLLFTGRPAGALVIHYGLIYVVCGFAVPWGYTLLVERGKPAGMGFSRERWVLSLILNVALGGFFTLIMLSEADLSAINLAQFSRAAFALLVGNLFELFLYYGFIHLRLEKAFGTIPAILATSAIYALWHTGTQLPLEADPLAALGKLFLVGVLYQSVFSITRNLLTIWPFFVGAGVLIDYVVNLGEIERMSVQFPWAVGTLISMVIAGAVLAWVVRRQSGRSRVSG